MRRVFSVLFFFALSCGMYGHNVCGEWENVSSETFLEEDISEGSTPSTKKGKNVVVENAPTYEPPEIKDMEESSAKDSVELRKTEEKPMSDVESCSFIEVLGGTCFGLNMGWNCRFQQTAFVMGVIFGGAVALERRASVSPSKVDSIDNFLTLGYFDAAFRFGFAFHRFLPFVKFGWCVDRYSIDVEEDDGTYIGKSWFNGLLYGIGCDFNLSRSLSIGLAVDLHSAFGHTLDFFVEDDTTIYRPRSMQYFITAKYQITK